MVINFVFWIRIDLIRKNTALATTGAVWAYYATLVKPRANILLACSVALLGVHGYNITRRSGEFIFCSKIQH